MTYMLCAAIVCLSQLPTEFVFEEKHYTVEPARQSALGVIFDHFRTYKERNMSQDAAFEESDRMFQPLAEWLKSDRGDYVRQVIEFTKAEVARTKSVDGVGSGMLCNYLFFGRRGVTEKDRIEAVWPYYSWLTTDLKYRYRREWGVDMEAWETVLKEYVAAHGTCPLSLVDMGYDRDPESAVIAMAKIQRLTDSETGDLKAKAKICHMTWSGKGIVYGGTPVKIERSQATLRSLVVSPHWWVRLYVAEFMQNMPELRADDIVDSLRKESCPLIKLRIKQIDTDPKRDPAKEREEGRKKLHFVGGATK